MILRRHHTSILNDLDYPFHSEYLFYSQPSISNDFQTQTQYKEYWIFWTNSLMLKGRSYKPDLYFFFIDYYAYSAETVYRWWIDRYAITNLLYTNCIFWSYSSDHSLIFLFNIHIYYIFKYTYTHMIYKCIHM